MEVGMCEKKIKLSYEEQIEHLKKKGVKFNIISEDDAKNILVIKNNFYKITSYRKNYNKYQGGKLAGKYIDLDFAYLKDLSGIDKEVRYVFIQMSLDIEHFFKVNLLRLITESDEDGYSIIEDFKEYLIEKDKKENKDEEEGKKLKKEIERGTKSIYNDNMVEKYAGSMPVWVFVEIIPFGRLITFCKFCAEKFNNKVLKNYYFLLLTCKDIRNAAAHNSCIINDLHVSGSNHRKPSYSMLADLYECKKLKKTTIRSQLNNERVRQIVTLLYSYKVLVESDSSLEDVRNKLEKLLYRINLNFSYYEKNTTISNFISFFNKVVEFWFDI